MPRLISACLLGALALTGCGDAETDVPATDTRAASPNADGVVQPERLLDRFPEAVGPFPMGASSTDIDGALGYQVARATARYTVNIDRPGPAVVLNVLDLGTSEMAENMGYGWGTGADTTDVDSFEGFPAQIEANERRRTNEVRVLVADRFLIEALGEGADMDLVREAARSLDLAGLAALAEG